MKKILVGALVIGLIAGSLTPAVAKKKKKKKKSPVLEQIDQNFYLRALAEPACSDDTKFFLSVESAEDGAGACGNLAFGAPLEALIVAGQDAGFEYSFPATDGVPVTFDATKSISGLIGVSSFRGVADNPGGLAAGQATLEITITAGTSDGAVTLGATSVDYLVNPSQQTYEIEFEMEPAAELDKVVFDSLSIALRNRGATVLHGYYTVDNPDSFFTIGAWAKPQ